MKQLWKLQCKHYIRYIVFEQFFLNFALVLHCLIAFITSKILHSFASNQIHNFLSIKSYFDITPFSIEKMQMQAQILYKLKWWIIEINYIF